MTLNQQTTTSELLSENDSCIKFENVTISYGKYDAVRNVYCEIPKGNVGFNATRVHHTLEAVGEDAPRRRAKVCKGNEFSVLSAKNSSVSRLGPWILLIIGSMGLFFF